MAARVLMVQGTSSSAGKSLLVTALCRIYARCGVRVAPFKAQNMSNNAGVCADGSEIGRSQITQALAAGVAPVAEMNPILLKPEPGRRVQVVVMGRRLDTIRTGNPLYNRQTLWTVVTDALAHLRQEYELIIAEGAGSPVELNLKHSDIVNMALARHAAADVLLVGDIDRGGIFAQLLGTLWLLPEEERALVRGLIVNKFRGDMALFEEGVRILQERGGKPVLGVIPWIDGLHLPEEDGATLDHQTTIGADDSGHQRIDIAVIQLPCIANFDDFDPLRRESAVRLRFIRDAHELDQPQAIILPGTKSTMTDLDWLRNQGLADRIMQLAAAGTEVVGICGGYQMLGEVIYDPHHVEGARAHTVGLGLLPVSTTFDSEKATHQATARITCANGWLGELAGTSVSGYEIHMGRTVGANAWLSIERRVPESVRVEDGAISPDQRIWGCYLHGLFANDHFRRVWLRHLGVHTLLVETTADPLTASIDRLADVVESAIHIDRL